MSRRCRQWLPGWLSILLVPCSPGPDEGREAAPSGGAADSIPERLARGDVEIGFQQISGSLPVDGVVLVGPIPEAFQRNTTFSAGITSDAQNPGAARRLLDYLCRVGVTALIADKGLDPVATEQ